MLQTRSQSGTAACKQGCGLTHSPSYMFLLLSNASTPVACASSLALMPTREIQAPVTQAPHLRHEAEQALPIWGAVWELMCKDRAI